MALATIEVIWSEMPRIGVATMPGSISSGPDGFTISQATRRLDDTN